MKTILSILLLVTTFTAVLPAQREAVQFSVKSVADGDWTNPKIWQPQRLPKAGDRVLVSSRTSVRFDAKTTPVIRLIQVAGTLRFARDRSTELNVCLLKVQAGNKCTERGFACDFNSLKPNGEPNAQPGKSLPTLEVGTQQNPIPAAHTARIRLHYLEGMDKKDAPALVCCSARMELHGSPLERPWVKLGATCQPGDAKVVVNENISDWRIGDEIIVTASKKVRNMGTYRDEEVGTEERIVKAIDGHSITLDKPLSLQHSGEGEFRSEVANLSRNVIVESADPDGVRGHTMYHRDSKGGISYARFAHLGKEGELGRYPIHFHLVGDTMRGSAVLGVAVVDSHNRWVTIHGTQYLLVRDCVGYKSVGHGYFLENGSEVFNLLDRNLGVQAFNGPRLKDQELPFDPNDGAAFWWANGRNVLTRNVAVENAKYGFRYDCQKRSNFDSNLRILMPDGSRKIVDIRTLAISRFEKNESHSEGLYSVVLAGTEGVGPDLRHPHLIRDLKIWQTHYAFRAQLPTMLAENIQIDHASYGVYRPWFENHVYRDLSIAATGSEPFNRGLDDKSVQHGSITVDGLTFSNMGYGGSMPLIQISANNVNGEAESHFRNVTVQGRDPKRPGRWPLINLGGGPRLKPSTPKGVPYFIHDYFGPGKHAKVISSRAKDLLEDGNKYSKENGLTGDESLATRVSGIDFPELLSPVDDLPPCTIITRIDSTGDRLLVRGTTHDNGVVKTISVNGKSASILSQVHGVADWSIELPKSKSITATATDATGNRELNPHKI
jgi:hypothetical protein